MLTFSPTRRLSSVDFPELVGPTRPTNPVLKPSVMNYSVKLFRSEAERKARAQGRTREEAEAACKAVEHSDRGGRRARALQPAAVGKVLRSNSSQSHHLQRHLGGLLLGF